MSETAPPLVPAPQSMQNHNLVPKGPLDIDGRHTGYGEVDGRHLVGNIGFHGHGSVRVKCRLYSR
jgi:hypothetical protein